MRYQLTCAWISLSGFALGAVIALTGCFGTRFGCWSYNHGTGILVPGVAVGAVALLCGLTWLVRALKANDSMGGRMASVGLIGSALLVEIPLHHLWLVHSLPQIHDISTDIGDAPQFRYLLAWRAGAANPPDYDGPKLVMIDGKRISVSLAQKYAYVDIKPLERFEPVGKYFWRSLNTVNALGWQVAGFDLKTGRIEATATSFWFGVVSDIAIRVRPAGAIGMRVDIRSKSRIGEGDGGRNAALVRDFLSKVKGG